MFEIFTLIADWAIIKLNLTTETHLGESVHFFIEDSLKIFFLIYFMIFFISLFRSQLSPEKVKSYVSGKKTWYGYALAAFLGAVTPFCTCSSIPVFIGFLAAGLPFGISMAFLISSPLISEIAAIMLFGMKGAGPLIAVIYILNGFIIAIIAGWLCDKFNIIKYVSFIPKQEAHKTCGCSCKKQQAKALIKYAHDFAIDMIKSIYLYIIIGLIIGAAMHGYVPQEIFVKYLGANNIWATPFASIAGIPIYASHGGVVPIIQVLLLKGVPIGTALVMLMSITAISLPEIIMLKKVFSYKLLVGYTLFMLIAFMISGYVINMIQM